MVILIVEDDSRHAEKLKEMLNACVTESEETLFKDPDIRIRLNAKEALYDVEDGRVRPDIVFIAVRIGSLSGVEIAGKMQESVPTVQIIFIAESGSYSPDVYEVDHIYLIEKEPCNRTVLKRALRKALDRIGEGDAFFECVVNRRRHYIPYHSILYFENIKRKITIHTDLPGELVSFYETMARLETILPDNFVRCHNSFIVNRERISSYGTTSVRIGNKEISVSRKYKDLMKRQTGE